MDDALDYTSKYGIATGALYTMEKIKDLRKTQKEVTSRQKDLLMLKARTLMH